MDQNKEIQRYIKENFGCHVKTCWIADAKEKCKIYVRPAHNRLNPEKRKHTCPDNKFFYIKEALENLGIIEK
jgi:hypothetical protein